MAILVNIMQIHPISGFEMLFICPCHGYDSYVF